MMKIKREIGNPPNVFFTHNKKLLIILMRSFLFKFF